jgi:hypothetical protein
VGWIFEGPHTHTHESQRLCVSHYLKAKKTAKKGELYWCCKVGDTHTSTENCVELRVCGRDSRKSNDDNCSSDLVIIDINTRLEVYQQQQQELLLWSNQSHQQSSLCAIVSSSLMSWDYEKTFESKRRFGFSWGSSSFYKESQILFYLWISTGPSCLREKNKQKTVRHQCLMLLFQQVSFHRIQTPK